MPEHLQVELPPAAAAAAATTGSTALATVLERSRRRASGVVVAWPIVWLMQMRLCNTISASLAA